MPRIADKKAQAEGVPGRIGIHLEVIPRLDASRGLQDPRPEGDHTLVRFGEVVHPQVEVDLLTGLTAGPGRRRMTRSVLHPDPRFAVDHYHVPAIFTLDYPAEHARPERTLCLEVSSVEHDNLISDLHNSTVAPSGAPNV